MSVDKEKIENILRSDDFSKRHIKEFVERKKLRVGKDSLEKMINALLSAKWTEEEFESLKDKFGRIQKEKAPLGYYVGEITDLPNLT